MLRAHVAASVAALTAAGRSMRGPPRLPRVAPRAPVAPPRRYCHRRSSGHGQGRHGRNQSGAAPDEHQHRGVAWQETVRLAHEAASRISHSVKNPGSVAPQMGAWAKRHSILCPHGAQAIAQVLRRCLSTASDSAADTPPSFQAANNAWREAHQARHGWNPPAWAYAGFGEFHPGRYRHWTSEGSWSTGETPRTRSETAAPQTPPPVMDTSTPPSQPQHATPSPTAPHSTASLVCSFIRRGLIGIFNTVALGALGIIYIVSAIYFIGLMLVIVLCTIMMWIEAARDKAKAKAKAEGKKPVMWVAKANDTPPVEVSSSLFCFLVIVAFLVIACGSPATTNTEQSKAVTAAAPVERKPAPPKTMHSAPGAPAAAPKAAQSPPAPASEALAEHAAVAQAAEALARVVRSLRL